jgi:hypothetical protein
MAQLTWREMTAPDVSTSLKGYDQFTSLLNSALGGARDAIGRVDDNAKEAYNNQVQLALATTQDPAALKAALTDPAQTAKLNPARLNAQTIAAIGARPGQLTQQAAQELALKDSTRLFDQAVTADTRAPLLAQAHELNRQIGLGVKGAKEQFAAFSAANPDLVSGLGYKTTSEFQKGLEDAQKSGQDFTIAGNTDTRAWNADARAKDENSRQWGEYGMKKTEFGWRADDRRTDEIATGFVAQAMAGSDPNDPESIRAAVFANPQLQGQSGKVKAAVYSRLAETFPGLFKPDDVGVPAGAGGSSLGGGGATGSDNGRVMGWSPASDNPAASVTNKIGLIAKKAGAGTDAPLTKGQFLSLDMTQLEGKPAAPNNFGNMKNVDGSWKSFKSPQEYSAAQKAWLERRWNEGARTVTDAVLGRRVGGGSTPAVQAGIALRRGQENQGQPEANDLVAAGSKDANPLDVIDQLKANPRFAGTSRQFVKSALDDIVHQGTIVGANGQRIQRVNYAQAAIILQRATQENNDSWGITNWLGGNSVRVNKNGDRINYGMVKELTDGLKSGNLQGRVAREADLATASGQIATAQSQADAALANLNRISDRARSQPQLAGAVTTAQQKYAAMAARLEALKRQVGPSTQPIPAAPQPSFSQQASSMWNDITNGSLFTIHRGN